MNIKTIREGIADSLRTIQGVQVSAYVLSNPTVPSLQVLSGKSSRLSIRRGLVEREFQVQGFFGLHSDIGAQMLLDRFCDESGLQSVVTALTADPTFGGVCEESDVDGDSGTQVWNREGSPAALGTEWTVRVLTSS